MARIRTIKPDFWRDESLAIISSEACLLAIGLLNHCDDEGYFNANPRLVESDIFPLRELSKKTTVLLQELSSIGYLGIFEGDDGKIYGYITNFEKHQVINKKTPSKIKHLCNLQHHYHTTTEPLPTGREGKGKEMEMEMEVEKKATGVACPPDVDKQVWTDWLSLRKSKKAAVTQTVVEGARNESAKAGISFESFLKIWCLRGSQGLQADWLKPDEIGRPKLNKQEALEASNRSVVDRYLKKQGLA